MNFSYLPKIDFVIPEGTTEYQRYWRNFIYRWLSEEDDQRDNIGTLEVILLQVHGPSKARRMHGNSSDGVAMGASQTCKIKQSRRAHFDPGEGDWVYNRRRRVRVQRRSKLHPRGDGPFHVLTLIGNKGYILGIESTDSRTNLLEEREYDMIRGAPQFIKISMIVGERVEPSSRLQRVDKDGHLHVRATESIILKTTSQWSSNMLGTEPERVGKHSIFQSQFETHFWHRIRSNVKICIFIIFVYLEVIFPTQFESPRSNFGRGRYDRNTKSCPDPGKLF